MKAANYPWRARLDSADRHLARLEQDIDEFLATNPYRVLPSREKDSGVQQNLQQPGLAAFVLGEHRSTYTAYSRSYEIAWYVRVDHEPPDFIGEGIGDTVESLRSCLEIIMFWLAKKNSGPLTDSQARSVAFPVKLDPAVYLGREKNGKPKRDSGLWNTQLLEPAVQAAVEQLQPFQQHASLDPLYMLDRLRQQNFHREPLLAVSIGGMTRFGMNNVRGASVTTGIGTPDRPPAFRTGDEVYRIRIDEFGPHALVELVPQPSYHVSFKPDGPGQGRQVLPTLTGIRNYLRDVVFPALEPFA